MFSTYIISKLNTRDEQIATILDRLNTIEKHTNKKSKKE